MDFMGIGPLEILVVLLLAFLFFGPEKLPEIAAKAGRVYRNIKQASFDLSRTIVSELPDENNSSKSMTEETEIENTGDTTETPVSAPGEEINEQ